MGCHPSAVDETDGRRPEGRALQERLIDIAQGKGLFQIRSYSDGKRTANRALKLSLGFGVHPVTRKDDPEGPILYCL